MSLLLCAMINCIILPVYLDMGVISAATRFLRYFQFFFNVVFKSVNNYIWI